MNLTRSAVLRAAAGTGAAAFLPRTGFAQPAGASLRGEPEIKNIKVGLSSRTDIAYLPLFIADTEKLWQKEGLGVELVIFSGDGPATQALAGGSVDLNVASMIGFLNLQQAGQPVKAIYLISDQAAFSFVASSKIRKWSDLKGGTFGISSYGSLTEAIATVALEKNGLKVGTDVQLVQTGGSPNAYAAIQSGQLSGSVFTLPFAIKAKAEGFTILGTQAQVTGPDWPIEAVYAKQSFLNKNPKTVTALLRGIVAADKIIAAQPALAVQILEATTKLDHATAATAFDAVKSTYHARGQFSKDLSAFWNVAIESKAVPAVLPPSEWYDGTWIDSFGAWSARS